jgi:hypothetical protein
LPSYVFPGFPIFLELAESELDRPGSAGPARRISALTELANLCAQAARSPSAHVEGILAKAAEFRDQLIVALRAAELMIDDVETSRRVSRQNRRLPEAGSPQSSESRSGRKEAGKERLSS